MLLSKAVSWKGARLAALIGASGISTIGSRMTFIAIPWLVLETTGSPTKMGIVAGAEMLPYVLASALGAPVAERVGHRRMAIFCDLASVGAMCAIVFGAGLGVWPLVALVFVAGGLRGFADNSRKVMVPPLAKEKGFALARIVAIFDGMTRLSMMIGASIAGILIVLTSVKVALVVDAVSFAVAGLIVMFAVPRGFTVVRRAKEPYFRALAGGFVQVWRDKVAFGMLAMLFFINVFNQASGVVLIPLWADQVTNSATAVGLVLGAMGLGAVVGSIAFAFVATKVSRYATLTIAFLIGGPPRFLVLGISEDVSTVLIVTFLSGMALAAVNPIVGVSFLDRTPDELWPRVQGLMVAVAWAGIPLGGLLAGWAAQEMGLQSALVLTSLLYLVVALVPIVGYRSWRGLNQAPVAQPAVA